MKNLVEAGNRDGTPVEFGKRIRSGWVVSGKGGGGGARLDGNGYAGLVAEKLIAYLLTASPVREVNLITDTLRTRPIGIETLVANLVGAGAIRIECLITNSLRACTVRVERLISNLL